MFSKSAISSSFSWLSTERSALSASVVVTDDEIAFPVARHQTTFDLRRSRVDTDQTGNLVAPIHVTTSWPAFAVALSQAGDEFLFEAAARHHIEHVVDGRVRDLST